MRPWQKRIDFASFPVERQRMGARFRRHDFLATHRGNIDDVDDARIADGDIKVTRSLIEKNYVWGAAERHIAEYAARHGVNCEQDAGIAGAEKTVRRRIKI